MTLTVFSLAPIYLFKTSGPFTLIKFSPHSLAIAEASRVLPHPGYPYNNNLTKGQGTPKSKGGGTHPDRKRKGD